MITLSIAILLPFITKLLLDYCVMNKYNVNNRCYSQLYPIIRHTNHEPTHREVNFKIYKNSALGISYEYPSTWKLTKISPDGNAVGDWVTQLISLNPNHDKQINLAYRSSIFVFAPNNFCWHTTEGGEILRCTFTQNAQSVLYENTTITTDNGIMIHLGKDARNRKGRNPQSFAAFIKNSDKIYEFTLTSYKSGVSENDPEYSDFITLLKSISFPNQK